MNNLLSTQLSERLQQLFINGRWITNTNYKELLSDVDMVTANRQIGSLNTIALLTFHINYYLEGLNKVFSGGPLAISDKYSFDMSPLASEGQWQELKQRLITNSELFIANVKQLSNDQLQAPFVREEYGTWLRNIEGVIEHSYYHLGQMVLIRKMMEV